MIIWENINYNSKQAKDEFEKIEINSRNVGPIDLDNKFQELREKLINARNEIFEANDFDNARKLEYSFDLLFGIEVYKILNESIGFKNRVATSNDVWRYLSVRVIPDIVHARVGLNEVRFYASPRRIWLKTIWWYIHLSWRGSSNETYKILKGNTTDTIASLVERPNLGYYIEVYRELLLQYHQYTNNSRDLFRAVLKINTAKLVTTSPELVDGGIKEYVNSLFISAGAKESHLDSK